jgi:outer membrane protein OmpA-like peptidoglycan-associated protein
MLALLGPVVLAGCVSQDLVRAGGAESGGHGAMSAGATPAGDVAAGTGGAGTIGSLSEGGARHYMENQKREFATALGDAQRRGEIDIELLPDGSLKLNLSSEASFDVGSAVLKPAFSPTLQQVVDILKRYDRTVVHLIGHTDSAGPPVLNQRLSEERARSVAQFMLGQGVSPQRLQTQGRGEREPRYDNSTPEGRQLNRRVELIIKPVIRGQEQQAFEVP